MYSYSCCQHCCAEQRYCIAMCGLSRFVRISEQKFSALDDISDVAGWELGKLLIFKYIITLDTTASAREAWESAKMTSLQAFYSFSLCNLHSCIGGWIQFPASQVSEVGMRVGGVVKAARKQNPSLGSYLTEQNYTKC